VSGRTGAMVLGWRRLSGRAISVSPMRSAEKAADCAEPNKAVARRSGRTLQGFLRVSSTQRFSPLSLAPASHGRQSHFMRPRPAIQHFVPSHRAATTCVVAPENGSLIRRGFSLESALLGETLAGVPPPQAKAALKRCPLSQPRCRETVPGLRFVGNVAKAR